MFLFDIYKTSQQKFITGDQLSGERWITHLRTNPNYCAESTAAVDNFENLYFGSHSGNFYCLNSEGKIRWTFSTKKRIYGSPVLFEGSVIFTSGDGFLYCLDKQDGSIIWIKDLKKGYFDSRKLKIAQTFIHLPFTFSFRRRTNLDVKSWSSVSIIENSIIITGFGKGLYSFNYDGTEAWSYDLGFPRYQLSGVVCDDEKMIYCVARNCYIYKFDKLGKVVWKTRIIKGWHSWGNPSYNPNHKHLYCVFSKGENYGRLFALSKNGKLIWQCNLKSTIRGSVAISNDGKSVYCADFKGYIYHIDALTGDIKITRKISNAIRALWTTPTVDLDNNIYISTKDSIDTGRVIKLDRNLKIIWEYKTNKTLCTPLIMSNKDVCFGSWDGNYYRIKTE